MWCSGSSVIYKNKCVSGKCCDTPCLTKDGYKCCQNCNSSPDNVDENICLQPCGPGGGRNITCGKNQKCLVIGNVDPTSNVAIQSKTDPNIIYDTVTKKNIYLCKYRYRLL